MMQQYPETQKMTPSEFMTWAANMNEVEKKKQEEAPKSGVAPKEEKLGNKEASEKQTKVAAANDRADKVLKKEAESHKGINIPEVATNKSIGGEAAEVMAKGSVSPDTIAARLNEKIEAPDLNSDNYSEQVNNLFSKLADIGIDIPKTGSDITSAAKSVGIDSKKAESLGKMADKKYDVHKKRVYVDSGEEVEPMPKKDLLKLMKEGKVVWKDMTPEEVEEKKNVTATGRAINSMRKQAKALEEKGYNLNSKDFGFEDLNNKKYKGNRINIPVGERNTLTWMLDPTDTRAHTMHMIFSNGNGQSQHIILPISKYNMFNDEIDKLTGGNYTRNVMQTTPRDRNLTAMKFDKYMPFRIEGPIVDFFNKYKSGDLSEADWLLMRNPEQYLKNVDHSKYRGKEALGYNYNSVAKNIAKAALNPEGVEDFKYDKAELKQLRDKILGDLEQMFWANRYYTRGDKGIYKDLDSPENMKRAMEEFAKGKKANFNNVPSVYSAYNAAWRPGQVIDPIQMLDMTSEYNRLSPEEFKRRFAGDVEARNLLGVSDWVDDYDYEKEDDEEDEKTAAYRENKEDILKAISGIEDMLSGLDGLDKLAAKQRLGTLKWAFDNGKWVDDPLQYIDSDDNRVIVKSSKREGMSDKLGVHPEIKRKKPEWQTDEQKLNYVRQLEAAAKQIANVNNADNDPYLNESSRPPRPVANAHWHQILKKFASDNGMHWQDFAAVLPLNEFADPDSKILSNNKGKWTYNPNVIKALLENRLGKKLNYDPTPKGVK